MFVNLISRSTENRSMGPFLSWIVSPHPFFMSLSHYFCSSIILSINSSSVSSNSSLNLSWDNALSPSLLSLLIDFSTSFSSICLFSYPAHSQSGSSSENSSHNNHAHGITKCMRCNRTSSSQSKICDTKA